MDAQILTVLGVIAAPILALLTTLVANSSKASAARLKALDERERQCDVETAAQIKKLETRIEDLERQTKECEQRSLLLAESVFIHRQILIERGVPAEDLPELSSDFRPVMKKRTQNENN